MGSHRLLIAALVGAVPWAMAGSVPSAGQPAPERKGVLAKLPSPPGPTVEKIKALGDNEWLNLGPPAADPKWGKGRGRSWSCRMAYAPDLQGAFLAGQGMHGFIKPDGRYDDLFFYDLNAHRWICIYPGLDTRAFADDVRNGALKANDDGQLVDRDGQPVLYAYGGHSYHTHAYDTDLRRWVTAFGTSGFGGDQYSRQMPWDREARKVLLEQTKGRADRVSLTPIFFNTVTGQFERYQADGPTPHGGVLFYLPTRKVLWQYRDGVTMLYDATTRRWANAGAKGPSPPGSPDLGACYDSRRDRLYLGRGAYGPPQREDEGHVYIYDVKTNSWSNPPNQANASRLPATNYGWVHYDPANDRVVILSRWEGKGAISIYDPETGAWEGPLAVPAAAVSGRECTHGFLSPEANAHFLFIAHDSDDRGTLWVYRYKRGVASRSR